MLVHNDRDIARLIPTQRAACDPLGPPEVVPDRRRQSAGAPVLVAAVLVVTAAAAQSTASSRPSLQPSPAVEAPAGSPALYPAYPSPEAPIMRAFFR